MIAPVMINKVNPAMYLLTISTRKKAVYTLLR